MSGSSRDGVPGALCKPADHPRMDDYAAMDIKTPGLPQTLFDPES